jgi:hypothetical protein
VPAMAVQEMLSDLDTLRERVVWTHTQVVQHT